MKKPLPRHTVKCAAPCVFCVVYQVCRAAVVHFIHIFEKGVSLNLLKYAVRSDTVVTCTTFWDVRWMREDYYVQTKA